MPKVLVVEDDDNMREIIVDWLEAEHYSVEESANGKDAQDKLAVYSYDLVILDWQLPELSGLDLLKKLRAQGDKTPVIMLTGKKLIDEKELGLDSGADDYLTKPFHVKELTARIRSLLRRSSGSATNVLRVREIELDPSSFTVKKNGMEVQLAKREFAVLEFFMRNPNKVFSVEALLERVWASESDSSELAVRTCLKKLRQKIEAEGERPLIKTVHGVGYKLDPS